MELNFENLKFEGYDINVIHTQRGEIAIIIDSEYLFRFERIIKNSTKKYICEDYRKSNKCKAFIELEENKIIKYDFAHNHKGNKEEKKRLIILEKLKKNCMILIIYLLLN